MSESELSRKIRDLRQLHGLTLEQIAQQVGVGRSTVRKWETGLISNMRRDKIAKLATALHTTPGYLMGWTNDPNAELINTDILCPSSIEAAKDAVHKHICLSPLPWHYISSGQKLKLLLQELNTDVHVFCEKFQIDEYKFYHWINNNKLPDYLTVRHTLESLNYFYSDFLTYDESEKFLEMQDEYNFEHGKNYISIAGRDGTNEQRILTDQQLSALKAILDQMPDASGDL